MVQLHNCPEFVFAYLACHKTGLVFCPVNFRLSAREIADCMDNSRPKVYLMEPEEQTEVELALTHTAHAPQLVLTTAPAGSRTTYAAFAAENSAEEPAVPWELSAYDETLRLFTSGTTGKQKSVCLTSINEVLSAHDVMMHFPFAFSDVSMNTTPWFHRGGLHSGGVTPTLYAGGTVVIQRKFQAAQTLDAVEQHGLTFLIGVLNVLELLAEEQQKHPRDLHSLHGIVTMGSPLDRADCIRYQQILTPKIFNGYGTTETFWNTFLRRMICRRWLAAPDVPAPMTMCVWFGCREPALQNLMTRKRRTAARWARSLSARMPNRLAFTSTIRRRPVGDFTTAFSTPMIWASGTRTAIFALWDARMI